MKLVALDAIIFPRDSWRRISSTLVGVAVVGIRKPLVDGACMSALASPRCAISGIAAVLLILDLEKWRI